ncbi:DUF1194 domain-containing protein [Oharaeibacter diazotrophicus]|uniref:Uncharacterized protein DUF1194 n=1 Tax=Oharaeibacter diazotrophicus TaxID=1920512 RepID=A0A4R6RF25_9HYPH|nr:DUF1194 domain-containing protein [Oharaeibacter diazotrophicus]TDP84266.1 uncharacterized protein DUF1194 [Oharaeibacter diazotrophicus]BBE73303.1 hypothetical protein OHA_1_02913 [Pleomorphomonas sp. SM30]GLS75094.1 hypothetical protein GCM10007904_04290 [Oharaeibacter diazotrophicus]
MRVPSVALAILVCCATASTGRGAPEPVDLELVLLADVSDSMDRAERTLQRRGYAAAFRDPSVADAVATGPIGRIAVTYVEYADVGLSRVVVPWAVLATAEDSRRFADAVEAAPLHGQSRTSISAALTFAAQLIDDNDVEGVRRVVDVSGDGPNNQGEPLPAARAAVLGRGIVINGLPIRFDPDDPGDPLTRRFDMRRLPDYYEDCVIGGPDSFMVTVTGRADLMEGIRRKLAMEIAGLPTPPILRVALRSGPRVPC